MGGGGEEAVRKEGEVEEVVQEGLGRSWYKRDWGGVGTRGTGEEVVQEGLEGEHHTLSSSTVFSFIFTMPLIWIGSERGLPERVHVHKCVCVVSVCVCVVCVCS